MAKVGDVIEKNINIINTFMKIGLVPATSITNYKIYAFYKTVINIEKKMDRYKFVADAFNCDISKVRNAIKIMSNEIEL